MILVEACVTSLSESLEACRAGARRLELCRDLDTGGLTPTGDLLSQIRAQIDIPVFAMVRPHPGSYRATPQDIATMLRQISELLDADADGIVLGVLDHHNRIDGAALRDLVDAAGSAPVTFHRAFDEVAEPLPALEDLVAAGVSRVLTSGRPGTAWDGRDALRQLVRTSRGRLAILAGGSVRGDRVVQLVETTGVEEVHARASAIPGVVTALRFSDRPPGNSQNEDAGDAGSVAADPLFVYADRGTASELARPPITATHASACARRGQRMKTLIIGGSGHVSGAVARCALEQGHAVWTVTRGERPLPEGVTPLIADRHDHGAMEAAVTGQDMLWDLVVDCICYGLPDMQQDIALFRSRASHFVFVSTDFVYHPFHRGFPQSEETDHYVTPEAGFPPYGWKKRQCELELTQADTGDMDWTILRPCHIYGPTSELGCLPLHGRDPKLIGSLRAGAPIELVGAGRFLQQPILAGDLAETILSVAGNTSSRRGVFNTAGPDVIESWQYYQIIAEVLGVVLTVEEVSVQTYLAEHPEHAPFICHRIYDTNSLREAGLRAPATSIRDGLRLHVEGLLERQSLGHGG